MSRAYLSWAQLSIPPALVLTGQSAGAQPPTLIPTGGVSLSGQAGVGQAADGSVLVGGTTQTRAYLSWSQLALPPFSGTSQALTGQSAASAYGTIIAGATRAYMSWARFTLPPSASILLAGQSAASAGGTLTPAQGAVQVLTGVSAAAGFGAVAQGRSWPLLGAQLLASSGLIQASDETLIFAGLFTPKIDVALPSVAGSAAIGSLTIVGDGVTMVPLVGAAAPATQGTIAEFQSVNVIGARISSAFGQPAGVGGATLNGQSGTADVGALNTGTVYMVGVSAEALAGDVGVPAHWTDVTAQTSIWTDVASASSTWANS